MYAKLRQTNYLGAISEIYDDFDIIFKFINLVDKNQWNQQFDRTNTIISGYSYDKESQSIMKLAIHYSELYKLEENEIEQLIGNQIEIFEQKIINDTWFMLNFGMRLFFTEKLEIQQNDRLQLIQLLNNLADQTKDYNETCLVQDIVDPELMPNYGYKNFNKKQQQNELQISNNSSSINNGSCSSILDNSSYYCKSLANMEDTEKQYKSLRTQYQWIPTIFNVGKENNGVKIIGNIHNLDRKGNDQLYKLLEKVFQQQLPLFRKIEGLQEAQELQVIFKAQKYIIKPGQSYEGKWHLEGKAENIKAASVYYIQIDDGFEKDQLIYRTQREDEEDYSGEQVVDIKEECSLVFQNNLPHKFDALVNKGDKDLERLFINFFVIDPQQPIQLNTSDIDELRDTIAVKLNQNIARYIMQFLGFEYDVQKGKERRLEMRENSHKEINGWGYIHYGNCGGLKFVDSFHTDKDQRYCMESFNQQYEYN